MPKHPRHDREVYSLLDEDCCGRVPKVVEPLMWQPGPLQRELEVAGYVPRIERRALVSGEHMAREAPGVAPSGNLPAPMLPHGIGYEWGELK